MKKLQQPIAAVDDFRGGLIDKSAVSVVRFEVLEPRSGSDKSPGFSWSRPAWRRLSTEMETFGDVWGTFGA